MARLPSATRDTVPAAQATLFDALTAPSGKPPATGPGSVLMHVPKLRELENELVNHARFESTLGEHIVELATLQAARAPFSRPSPNRKPWQITRKVDFPVLAADEAARSDPVPEAEHPEGMFACSVTLAPGATAVAPDPSRGNGQYIVVVKGSLAHDGNEHPAPALVHFEQQESPFTLRAGKDGLQAMVLNFSRAGHDAPAPDAQPRILSRWQCSMCQFTYDERDGFAHEGIAAGTRWEALPADWACPHCASAKKGFRQI